MEDMELLECLIDTEIKKLEYRIVQAKKIGNEENIFMYKHQRAGLKKALSFIDEINNMEV